MGGNSEANKRAAAITKAKYGEDFHAKIGSKGGKKNKGRKLTKEHKRKLKEAYERRQDARNSQG